MEADKPSRREADIQLALLIQAVELLKESNTESHDVLFDKVDCMVDAIKGKDGKPGLFTRMNVVESKQLVQWWWLGIISGGIMSAAIWIIKAG